MFLKIAALEISRSPLSIGVAGSQYTVCNATKNELLTKFFECALKFTENFQEVSLMGFLSRNLHSCKLQLSPLRGFKTSLEVLKRVAALDSSQNLAGKYASLLEKNVLMDVLLYNEPQKIKIKTSKGKIKFLQCRCQRQC